MSMKFGNGFITNTAAATPAQPGILEQIGNARTTCRELMELLVVENQGLAKQQMQQVEESLQQKKRLTLKLEMILQDLKLRRQEWHGRPEAQDVALRLAEEVTAFQTLAAKNLELLKAAYQMRADMVSIIRDTLDARAPRVQTYGRNGYMAQPTNVGTRLINRDI